MKTTARLLFLLGGSFLAVDAVYFYWSYRADNIELIGLLTMGLSGILCLLLAFYFGQAVRAGGPELWPEDRPDADVDDGDPEMGFFNPHSWWPFMLAAACTIVFAGLAVSAWIVLFAVPLLVISLVGRVFENYRGQYAQ